MKTKTLRLTMMTMMILLFIGSLFNEAFAQTINYRIRVHIIPLSDDDNGRAATTTAEQMAIHIEDANASFAAAGIRFNFDPVIDWTPLRNTILNSISSSKFG